MQGALSSIARLNCVDPQRRSWRHGSIAWRQSYLQSLAGRPVDRLAIDRVVTRIKLAALLTLVVGVLAVTAWELHAANVAAEAEAAGDRMEIVS